MQQGDIAEPLLGGQSTLAVGADPGFRAVSDSNNGTLAIGADLLPEPKPWLLRSSETETAQKPTAGLLSSCLTFCNSTIGAGILGFPTAFAKTGWGWGCILLGLNAALSFGTMLMLENAMRLSDSRSYSETMYATGGKAMQVCGDVLFTLNFFGVMIAYQQIVPDLLLDILYEMTDVQRDGEGDNAGWFWPFFMTNRQWMVFVTTVFVFWPMSLAPSVDFLRGVSAVATGAMCYMIGVVVWEGVRRIRSEQIPPLPCAGGDELECGGSDARVFAFDSFSDNFQAFSTFSFALASHGIVSVVRGELVNPTAERVLKVLLPCMLFCFALCGVTGVFGYLSFTNWVCANISESYQDNNFVVVGQIGVVVCIAGGHPVNMFPLKLALDKLLFFGSAPSYKRLCAISTVVVWSAGAMALLFDDLDDVLSLTGAIGKGPIAFVLPPIAFLNTRHGKENIITRLFCHWEGWVVLVLSCFVLSGMVSVVVELAMSGPTLETTDCGEICTTLPPGSCGAGVEGGR